ncbi:MAG TPA: hypothetical protein VJ813_17420 [Vicinamibacterales bacterium]|nr:hypothetical protein [Vicinamibacterales bacterium]
MNRVVLRVVLCLAVLAVAVPASAATLRVCASGCDFVDLQAAIDAAAPGDTILLRAGETFVGPFVLRRKAVSTQWIEIRSDAADASLPPAGVRLVPSGKPGANTDRSLLARLLGRDGSNYRTSPVVRTEPGAHHYILRFLEIDGTANLGWETLIAFGDDTTAATATDIVMDRVYAHGHFQKGQKRGVALNSARTDILNSYISDIRAVGFDSQAIGGYNGAGPYRIINNYLEASGENIMFGGADPAVQNLVPTGIEIRRNHIYKPFSWREAILSPPGSPRASDSGTGGALGAGTHYFKVVALLDTGPVVAHSLASTEAAVSLPGSRTATLSWTAVAGADRYRVYRGTAPGAQSVYMETTSAATGFQYTGIGERSGSVAAWATLWSVKNLIELKNAQNVLIDGNVIENIWPAGQNGYAIVLTPRNQSGAAPWVCVRDVTFSNNVIRNAQGVVTLTGYDDLAASQQTQRITFRNNLIYDIDPMGGWNKAFAMGYGPASIVIDHNTIVHKDTAVVFPYAGTISGFSFTNNVTLHNEYGIMGDNGRPGTYSIDMYFPGGVVTNNVLAGGVASAYPTPNAFPTLAEWNASFVDLANDDYRLRTSSVFYAAGAGGTVPGVDFGQLNAALSASPSSPTEPAPGPAPSGNTAPVSRPGGPYSATVGAPFIADGSGSSDAEGSLVSYSWRWHDDILIYAHDVPASDIVGSAWTRVSRTDAAGGSALSNPDRGAAKISTALASPASYVDVRFHAAAGVPYHIWMRARAQSDAYTNDSVFVQFSSRVDTAGRAQDRIGTSSAAKIVVEDGSGAGLSGWGWNDESYGSVAGPVYFATSGPQTIRIQEREDGFMWDQIVISSAVYASSAPGSTRNDGTILPRALGTTNAAVASHTYRAVGAYPIVLSVQDGGGLVASAATTVNVSAGGAAELAANPGGPYAGTTSQAVTFDGSASSASTAAQYFWTFGDDIVLDPSDLNITGTRWQRVNDSSAATGVAIANPDLQEPKVASPLAAPASYVEATFRAAAGVPYRLWIRMRAENDAWTNDAIFVQFSGSVTSGGSAVDRIGTSGAMKVVLEEGTGAGLLGWGWADGAYGSLDGPVYFNSDGEQRIRIQQREDGLRIDQVVISADTYSAAAPGALKQDTTIVPVYGGDATGAVVSHQYRFPGLFPVRLIVVEGGASATAATTAAIK